MEGITIRTAAPQDAAALLAIYAPYVENTCISYEYTPPTVEEFAGRIAHTLEKYPYLTAASGGELLGYVYAGPLHARAAYDWAVETSIYVREDQTGRGLGRLLYQALEQALGEQGILNMNACIAYPPKEDEYLTRSSAEFHEHMGFRLVGRFRQCSYKFGRWYDMVWMEKHIGEHLSVQPPVKPFPLVRPALGEKYGIL
ncbi:MAG: N-acetyltransferase family protein [Oscillospiraceae bacterium]|nr:N-acetyltransferase family protein [Oscillospiraceae bacterium]